MLFLSKAPGVMRHFPFSLYKPLAAKPTYSLMCKHTSFFFFFFQLPFIEEALTKMTFDNLRNQTAAVRAFPGKKNEEKEICELNSLRSLLFFTLSPAKRQTHTPNHPPSPLFNKNFLLALPKKRPQDSLKKRLRREERDGGMGDE